ncbi:MAG: DUF2079 domain-containing protein [bacterium]|nr:DUF2079 domain-containing protein [bacterium]
MLSNYSLDKKLIFSLLKKYQPYLIVFLIYSIIVPVEIYFRHLTFRTSGWDLGIYHQALSALSKLENLNPLVSIRMLHIFQDHFDLLLIPISFIFRLWNSAVLLLILDQFFTVLGLIPIVLATEKIVQGKSPSQATFLRFSVSIVYLFSDFLWSAIYFPSHPTHWAMGFMSWICYFVFIGKFGIGFFLNILLLFSCKEEFPFIAFPLSLILFQSKKRVLAIFLIVFGVLWILIFLTRPLWLGEVADYTNFIGLFFHSPNEYFQKFVVTISSGTFLKSLILLIPFFLVPYNKKSFLFLLIAIVPFLLRVFCLKTTAFQFHYSAIFVPIILFIFLSILENQFHLIKRIGIQFLILIFIGQIWQAHPFQHPFSSILQYSKNREKFQRYSVIAESLTKSNYTVAAPNNWLPHLSANTNVFNLAYSIDSNTPLSIDVWLWDMDGDFFPSTKNEIMLKKQFEAFEQFYEKISLHSKVELFVKPQFASQFRLLIRIDD